MFVESAANVANPIGKVKKAGGCMSKKVFEDLRVGGWEGATQTLMPSNPQTLSNKPLVQKTEIAPIGDDEVVHEGHPDGFSHDFHFFGQVHVRLARPQGAGGVVVCHDDGGGHAFQPPSEHDAAVHDGGVGAANAEFVLADDLVFFVQEQHPTLLVRQVEQQRAEDVVGIPAAPDFGVFGQVGGLPSTSQLHCGDNGDGLCFANSLELHQLGDAALAKVVQVFADGIEDALRAKPPTPLAYRSR